MTTKEQERKALAEIQKIVDGLGNDSYVATALDGALDLAEKNIDYDADFSARYYIDSLAKANDKISKLNAENRDLRDTADLAVKAAQKTRLGDFELSLITKLITEKIDVLQREINDASVCIVETAEDPTSTQFTNAVASHRTACKMLKDCNNVLKSITEKERMRVQ